MLKRTVTLLILSAGLALAGGEMRVEEPETPAAPPIDPEKEAWFPRRQSSPLTEKEKGEIAARRRKVEALAEKIREKRRALRESEGPDREKQTRELKDLILEPDDRDDDDDREDKELNKKEKLAEKQLRKKAEAEERKSSSERKREEQKEKEREGSENKGPRKKGKGKSGD